MKKTNNKNQNEMREEVIEIKGMHCKICSDKIESKISSLNGVFDIKVDLPQEKATIKYNPKEISLEDIKSEVLSLGYFIDKQNSNHKKNKNTSSLWKGIFYGLLPHTGCIVFLIGSIFGVTLLINLFRPLLMNRYFFYILIAISMLFATISSAIYLNKNSFLSFAGIKRKWKYLAVMYGSTILVNLLLFFIIFPYMANFSIEGTGTGLSGAFTGSGNSLSEIKLKVDIPCSGHAALISNDLKTIDGIASVEFSFPNLFDVKYESLKTSKDQILSLEVFKTYKAEILEESGAADNFQKLAADSNKISSPPSQPAKSSGSSAGSCCGSGSCGTGSSCGRCGSKN